MDACILEVEHVVADLARGLWFLSVYVTQYSIVYIPLTGYGGESICTYSFLFVLRKRRFEFE